MARPRKSKAAHDRDGTFRKDRHTPTVEHTFASGEPTKPKGLSDHQEKVWNVMVRRIPSEYLGEIDTFGLILLVDAFSDWMRFRALLEEMEPTAKGFWTLYCAKQSAAKILDRMLGKFGATPRDRTQIKEMVAGDAKNAVPDFNLFGNDN